VSSVVWLTSAQNKGGSMVDWQKFLKNSQDHSMFANWQGGIFALEKVRRFINSDLDKIGRNNVNGYSISEKVMEVIDSEILKLKNLCDSTDIGKTLNRVAEATVKAMEEEKERRKNESNI
jgi:hypothetical protein